MRKGDEDQRVKGLRLYKQPVANERNKFVSTEDEAWFLPFEDKSVAPTLGEILTAVVDLSDPEIEKTYDQKIEDGLVVLGYVDKVSRQVSIHLPDSPIPKDVKIRLDEVSGKGTTYD